MTQADSKLISDTLCPGCGFDVGVDENGCCITCGADATGPGVEQAHLYLSFFIKVEHQARQLTEHLREINAPDNPPHEAEKEKE